jgi:hypothetical protein
MLDQEPLGSCTQRYNPIILYSTFLEDLGAYLPEIFCYELCVDCVLVPNIIREIRSTIVTIERIVVKSNLLTRSSLVRQRRLLRWDVGCDVYPRVPNILDPGMKQL